MAKYGNRLDTANQSPEQNTIRSLAFAQQIFLNQNATQPSLLNYPFQQCFDGFVHVLQNRQDQQKT